MNSAAAPSPTVPRSSSHSTSGSGLASRMPDRKAHERGEANALPEESGSKSWSSLGRESQKSDYFPSDARLLCPQDPVVRRNVKFKVHHAVRQRGRHPVGNGLVLFAVARRYDTPAVGQTVFPDSPVQYELVTGGLNQWWRSVQFIKEDDALFRDHPIPEEKAGGHHSARPFSRRGSPRRSTGSSRTARMSRRAMPRSAATLATTWLLPAPGAPQRDTGW